MSDCYEIRQAGHPEAYDMFPVTPEGLSAALAVAAGQSAGGRDWEVAYSPEPSSREVRYVFQDGQLTSQQPAATSWKGQS